MFIHLCHLLLPHQTSTIMIVLDWCKTICLHMYNSISTVAHTGHGLKPYSVPRLCVSVGTTAGGSSDVPISGDHPAGVGA